jgi:hypothetical protein
MSAQFNGIGAASLMLLCISGAVLWWAGLKRWTRGTAGESQIRWLLTEGL